MAEYTVEQRQQLRDRWKGHEEKLKASIPVIKTDPKWEESGIYKALIETLGPLPEDMEKAEKDLRGANLREMGLAGALLQGADLTFSDLSKARLSKANLTGANLTEANLIEATLSGATLRLADLTKANLTEAHLRSTDLNSVDLSGANLSEADLRGADLGGANLGEANLRKATLHQANVSKANLWGVLRFYDADFTHTRWWEAEVDEGSAFYIYLQEHFPRVSEGEAERSSESSEARKDKDTDE